MNKKTFEVYGLEDGWARTGWFVDVLTVKKSIGSLPKRWVMVSIFLVPQPRRESYEIP